MNAKCTALFQHRIDSSIVTPNSHPDRDSRPATHHGTTTPRRKNSKNIHVKNPRDNTKCKKRFQPHFTHPSRNPDNSVSPIHIHAPWPSPPPPRPSLNMSVSRAPPPLVQVLNRILRFFQTDLGHWRQQSRLARPVNHLGPPKKNNPLHRLVSSRRCPLRIVANFS